MHIVPDYISYCTIAYHNISFCTISYQMVQYHIKSASHVLSCIMLYPFVSHHDIPWLSRIMNNLDTGTLCFWSLPQLLCPRMVWPEAPGETGPTTQHLLCAHSRMNSACRRLWVSGIPPVSPPTEAWRTSSDVAPPRSNTVAFRCWPPWDTSPQWLEWMLKLRLESLKIISAKISKVCFVLMFISAIPL